MTQILSLKTKISTPHFAATRDWYVDLLGLSVLEQWDEPGDRGCILGLAASRHVALLEIHACDSPQDFMGVSLQFRLPDVARFDVPNDPRFVCTGPIARAWGSHYLCLTDPNGVAVILYSGSAF